MGATLDALHRLQEVELQIAEVQQRIDRKHRGITKQEKRIAEQDAMISNKRIALRTDQMEADGLDVDMKAREAEIAKLRQVLNAAKTNKEYSAVLTQLNTNKANNSKVEERLLSIFSQLDAKRKEIALIEEERASEVAKLDRLKTTFLETEGESKDRLTKLGAERDLAATTVPATALNVFTRVANKNEGEALALVFRTNPKRREYACEGCNMSVTLEQVNTIMSRDEPVLCNTCGRILYLDSPTASRTH